MRHLLPLPLIALLAACGPNETDPGKGGVTVAEERALDEAAEMLEERRLPPEAFETAAASGEEAPAEQPAATETPAE
jgi:hypothetical protein